MTPEAQRTAIAEACGWVPPENGSSLWTLNGGKKWADKEHLPDYLHDLNAMHEAEKTLDERQISQYVHELWIAMFESPEESVGTIHATAAQRAEAFLRTVGRWAEETPP